MRRALILIRNSKEDIGIISPSAAVVKTEDGTEILIRQIAGAVARRIVTYSKENDKAVQGEQLGFIKFGSRVDVFLPLGTEIKVKLNQKVSGLQTVLAKI